MGDPDLALRLRAAAGALVQAGLVIGAGAPTAGAPEALTRWLVGLAPLLSVPASLVIVGERSAALRGE